MFRRRTILWRNIGAAATLVSLSLVATSAPAYAAEQSGETRKLEGYVISDPALAKDPGKIAAILQRDGSLDALGIEPVSTTENGKTVTSVPRLQATEDPPFVLDSAQYDRGAKPENPYQYIDSPADCAGRGAAWRDAGWIKNRFSYCQVKMNWAVDLRCGLGGCRTIGYTAIINTLIGYGKIGGDPTKPERRYADFQLISAPIITNGTFDRPGARMKATIKCAGEYRVKDGDLGNGDACHPAAGRDSREDVFSAWKANPVTSFTLQSEGYAPGPQWGEQLAQGVFHIEYEFGPDADINIIFAKSFEGGMRFDSADYMQWDKLGSVFDRAVPGLGYSKSDPKVARHAKFVEESRANPDATWPRKTGKKLLGGSSTHADSLHRVARSKGHGLVIDRNRDTAVAACALPGMPAPLPDEPEPFDCDEYAYASTYEGAAGLTDPEQHKDDFAVRWVNREHNQEAGRRLNGFYETQRILDVDRLFPDLNKQLDPNDQERFYIAITS